MTGTLSSTATGIITPALAERKSNQNEEINRDEFVKVSIIDFYEKDSDSNIRFDEKNKQEIKAVTLIKLIEKVTGSAAGTLSFSLITRSVLILSLSLSLSLSFSFSFFLSLFLFLFFSIFSPLRFHIQINFELFTSTITF
jgi:hypothetical protein